MKELRLDDKLNFVEEPVEIMDREVKQLKQSRIPIVKVRWNSKRGPEFTWEREDQIRAKKVEESLNVTFDETPPPSKTSPLVDDDLDEEEAKKVTKKKNPRNDIVDRNIAQGYNQQEGIDYDETYAPVARLESIRILLAYACALDFKLFQMDVKSAFLNGFINEEVYVAQPPGFIDFEKPDHVYKLKKALYGLKQAPKAWYDRLKAFLIKHEYKMGMVDNTLFTKKKSSNLIIVQIYVDDIIFGSTCQDMCDEFAKIMHDEFEMSMMGELNFFLGLQIKQMEDGIFFNQSKYIKEMLKKFGLEDSKPMKTPMSSDTKLTKDEECESVDSTKYRGMIGSLLYLTASRPDIMFSVCLCARFQEAPKTSHLEAVKRIFRYIKGTTHLGLWYPKGTGIETVVYADSDHAGDYVDQKSTNSICTLAGYCLTSWFSKKQTALAISTTKAEYISAEKACQQALWMKQALIDYDVRLDDVPIMCNNKGAIDLSKNPMQHSCTKHNEIRHLFLRDNVQKGDISIEKVPTVDNITDILTKPLKHGSFNYLRACVFTDRWRLDELAYGIPSDGPYQTNPPSIEDIITFNLAYYMAKRIEWVTKKARLILPYGILLTRLFKFIMNKYPKLYNESYVLYDRVMNPLATQLERKPRRDRGTRRGRHSTSSSSAFDQPSSSHLNNDDDNGNDEGTSYASTPSLIRYVNSLTNQVP
ncbi:retrovirus-related pol polyprotein from transposon TNT 1-94 [Tanacetum coccineum]